MPVEGGFLVKAGSMARREIVASARSRITAVHQRLISEGVVKENEGQLRFEQDYLFNSPSGAAGVVLGRSANGWIEWKRSDGVTLSQAKRVSRDQRTPLLDEDTHQQILAKYQELLKEGAFASRLRLESQYQLFRDRFGPAILAGVDGEALLTLMHDHSSHDSLVYWLEFKNDEEFETREFGSIAGGSALKFRIFRRKETGTWQSGGVKANQPMDISLDQAIEIARSHRDQLLKGCQLLDELSTDASDEDYAQLQDQMDELAPDVSRLAWGHKYFSLMYPNKLDDFHSPDWQRFHLLKMMQLPPEGAGRYICAGRFVAASKEVGIPFFDFTATLNAIHGALHRYWRIGTTVGNVSYWQMMQERSCVGVGWKKIGDISWVEGNQESRKKLHKILEVAYPNEPAAIGRVRSQLTQFVAYISEGDIVVAADGMAILGVGKVIGSYEYHSDFEFPHQRRVEWLRD